MKNLWIAGLFAVACVGCNAGSAPEPMTDAQLQDSVSKLPPQDQINYIRSTPMPQDKKDAKIAEIEKKFNMKADSGTAPAAPTNAPQ